MQFISKLVLVVEEEVVLELDYDKVGAEQGGGGGGSSGYVSDKIFSVTGGETISYSIGSGGGGGSVSLHCINRGYRRHYHIIRIYIRIYF
jgi:hypothetical protein